MKFPQRFITTSDKERTSFEEISWRMGFTDTAQLLKQAEKYGRNNSYGCFLYSLIENTSLQFLGQDRLVENPELSLS